MKGNRFDALIQGVLAFGTAHGQAVSELSFEPIFFLSLLQAYCPSYYPTILARHG